MKLSSSSATVFIASIYFIGESCLDGLILLIWSHFSIAVIPEGETRKIETFPVFCVTMVFSVFAYIWLLIILVVNSPDKAEGYILTTI